MSIAQIVANDAVAHSVLFAGLSLTVLLSTYIALQIKRLFAIFAPLAKLRSAMAGASEAVS